MGRYAMAYTQTASFPQTVTTTPVKLGYISAYTLKEGMQAVVGENSLIAKVPGIYSILTSVSLSIDANTNVYLAIYKNGEFTGFVSSQYVTVSGISNIVVFGTLELDIDDVVEIYIYSGTDSSYEITVHSSQFRAESE